LSFFSSELGKLCEEQLICFGGLTVRLEGILQLLRLESVFVTHNYHTAIRLVDFLPLGLVHQD